MQERAAGHGRRGIGISRRAVVIEEDLAVSESALEERRVAVEVLLEQVEPSAVQRHDRSIREREAGRADDLEARGFILGPSHIDTGEHLDRAAILGRRVQVGTVVEQPFQGPGRERLQRGRG